jgi:hypothetical protein
VLVAAEILGFKEGEFRLSHRILQNLHLRVNGHLSFATKPESVKEFYALATTVPEEVAAEEQRKSLAAISRHRGGAPGSTLNSMVVIGSAPVAIERRGKC